MEVGGLDFVAIFALTAALTLYLTPLALRLAGRYGVLDHPSEIKAQESPVPYLGGVAILVAFTAVLLGGALLRPPESGLDELAIILGLALLLAVVGLVDDLRGLSPFLRLGVEVACALVVCLTPAGAQLFDNDVVDLVVTVLWIVGVTNAFNLLDNMDGLSAGTAAIAALSMFAIAASDGQFLVATLAIALCGCAVGFLRSNFHPARIYMGDAGTLFLGFLLAVLGLKLELPGTPYATAFAVPIVVLGVPLFDTTLVTINRLVHRRSPLMGGRDHTSHRLVMVGIPVPAAVGLIYVAGASLGINAVVIARVDRTSGLLLVAWLVALSVLGSVLLSRVPVYETSRRRHLMLQEVQRHEPEPEHVVVDDEPEAGAAW